MSRWRTHHNRRRARLVKAGGLYTLQLCPTPSWGAEQLVVTMDHIRAEIHRARGVPAALLSSGPRL